MDQLAYLTKGCVDVIRESELQSKLELSARTRKPLVVKVGFDPTAPDLHLGHTVLIRKMKHFQDLGHTVVFVVGDFTGLIGDPTGRSKTRPPLTRAEIHENAETYKRQMFTLLDPVRTVVELNSRWLGALTSEEWIRLTARYNVAQMLERRDFRQRYEKGQPIRDPRVPLPACAGVRFSPPEGGRGAGRHRPAVQPERRTRHHAVVWPRAAGGDDHTAIGRVGWCREDGEVCR